MPYKLVIFSIVVIVVVWLTTFLLGIYNAGIAGYIIAAVLIFILILLAIIYYEQKKEKNYDKPDTDIEE